MSVDMYYYPKSLKEAAKLLGSAGANLRIIAGGTSQSIRNVSNKSLVDITRMGLDFIKKDKTKIIIGAASRIEDLICNKTLKGFAGGIVAEGAAMVGSKAIRNAVTLGGNIVQIYPWSDMPPVLLALGAQVKIAGTGTKTVLYEELVKKHPVTQLKKNELITEIYLPLTAKDGKGAFIKHALTTFDYAFVTVASFVTVKKGVCSEVRIAVGSVAKLPQRLPAAEKLLIGKKLDAVNIAAAAEAASSSITAVEDIRVSKEYKLQVLPALVRRSLEAIQSKYAK